MQQKHFKVGIYEWNDTDFFVIKRMIDIFIFHSVHCNTDEITCYKW